MSSPMVKSQRWPRITVVTPTFNRVEYLEECILSVLGQNYPNLEYIICDGGSKNTDVLALIRKYEKALAWWDSAPDRGHAEAIKRGFDRSTGEIMAYLCSDDAYCPGALLEVANQFQRHSNADLVYGNAYITDAKGRQIREIRSVPWSKWAMITVLNMVQPALFWTRDIYRRAGNGFGGDRMEYAVFEPQVDLMYRMARHDLRCVQTRCFLTNMRQHDGAVSARFRKEIVRVQRECLAREFPILSLRWIYRPLWWLMRARQLAWHIRQREFSYLRHRGAKT